MKPSKLAGLLAGFLMSASPAIGQVNLYKAEFNTDGNFEGWIDNVGKMKEFLYNGTTNTSV